MISGDGGGWDKLNLDADLGSRIRNGGMDDIAEAARGALCNPAGEKLLQYLIDEIFLTATWPGDHMGADRLVTYGAWREGQNSVVLLLHALIARGETLDDEEHANG